MSKQIRQQNDKIQQEPIVSFANMGRKRTKQHQIKSDNRPVVELLYETDEDYRLGRVGKSQGHDANDEIQELKKKSERRKKIFDVYEESPNGYNITADAPTAFDEAVKYYSFLLRQFTVELPDEHGIIHYTLGKIFLAEERATNINDNDKKGKIIENAIFHFNRAKEIFTASSHPIMYAVIGTILAQLYRTRTLLITNRSFLSKRSNTLESIGNGLAYTSEALPIFFTSQVHLIEYAICSLESGWLYFLQELEDRNSKPESADENREMAISHLERAISLMGEAAKTNRVRQFNYADPATYPLHIRLLLYNRSLNTVEGMAYYLLGCIYQDWSLDREHQDRAFSLFTSSIKPKYLQMDCTEWVDAHHRVANVIVRSPYVVDPEWSESSSSDVYLLSAVAHLELGLRSPRVDNSRRIDMNFHLAQAHILRLHTITDHIPYGQSLTQAIIKKEGLEIIQSAEECLLFACKGVTAANLQSTQDAYIYYYSCLKLAEFRMLEASCQVNAPISKREELLAFSVLQILNALHARSVEDNFDLHYIATIQMAQMISAAKRYIAAMKTYAKGLIVLQAMVNRMPYNRESIQKKMADESSRQVSQALLAMSKDTDWVKKHLGPFILIDIQTPTPGYALWSFEADEKFPDDDDEYSKSSRKVTKAESKSLPSKISDDKENEANKANANVKAIAKPPVNPPPQFNPSDTKVPRLNLNLATQSTGLPPLSAFGLDHNADNRVVYTNRRHKYIPSLDELHGNDGHSSTFNKQGLNKDRASVLFSGADNVLETTRKVKKKSESNTPKKLSFLSRFLGLRAKEPRVRRDLPKNAKDDVCRLWSSMSCLYAVMSMSRLSRLHLVIRAHALKVLQGERALSILNSLVPSLRDEYKTKTRGLKSACEGLVVPPSTLKELSLRSYDDLQKIFKSYPEIYRQILGFEKFLNEKLITEDYFLPVVHGGSALSTDVEAFNLSLLDSSRVLDGMKLELERNLKARVPQKPGAAGSPTKTMDQSLFSGLQREQEEEESLRLGRMTSELSQHLDGSLHGDIRHLFKYLKNDDCMLLWHLPQASSQKMQLVLIWKKPVKESNHKNAKLDPNPEYSGHDVVMELAKSDVSTSQLMSLVNTYLETLKVTPQPLRLSNMTDVIKSMSCLLSLSEVIIMIPPHVKSLIICCPIHMRFIPWNAMLIEVPSETFNTIDPFSSTNYKELYLLDKYSIRLGPTLNIFEMSSIAANKLKHAVGMHRLCAIDGEELSSAGIRSTEMEVGCITQTFSAEPTDYHVILGTFAAATCLRTGDSPKLADEIRKRKAEKRTQDEVYSDDDHWDALDTNKKSLISCRILHIAAVKVRLDTNTNLKVAAIELPRSREARRAAASISKNSSKSAKILSQVDMFAGNTDKRDSLNSKEFVSQLYVRNCALCVLSRFGIADDVSDIRNGEANIEFTEAVHMAGAASLLYPLWSGGTQSGVGILASQVFLIRFYSELPFHSADKRSIVTSCRRAQLWLRDATGDKTIEFLNQTPIPKRARDELIQEMHRFIEASVAPGTPYYDPNVKPGERHYFKHPLYWSNWTVSGWGGNVHHPDLHDLDDENEIEKGNTGGKHFVDDPELDNIEFELEILKKEGKLEEVSSSSLSSSSLSSSSPSLSSSLQSQAADLETFIRKRNVKKLQERLEKAKQITAKAGRGIMDTLEIVDRIVLDQDDDSIDVSDDEKKPKKKKVEKAKRKVVGDSQSAKTIKVESTSKEEEINLFSSSSPPPKAADRSGYLGKFMGSVNNLGSRMLRPLNDDGTLVNEETIEHNKKIEEEYEYIHEYDYDSGDDDDIGTFGTLIGYEGRKHMRMFNRSIERIRGEVRSKEEANEVAKQLIKDSQAEANRLAKLAIEKGKHHSKVIATKIIEKAKVEAKKFQDKKNIKGISSNGNDSDTLRTENKVDNGSEVCCLM